MLRFRKNRPAHIKTAPKERIYAIGDIHGRYDLLKQIMAQIVKHWENSVRDLTRVRLIFLGDIVDRGPDSDKCLAFVEKLSRLPGVRLIRGNHEDLMLRSIEGDADAQAIWLENGGLQTLESFAIPPPHLSEDTFDFADRLSRAIPASFVEMIRNADTHFKNGDYFFVHAGVRPGIPLSKQSDFDKFFIRNDFTQSDTWHGAMIVHGHSVVDAVSILPNRIAVDTGAYKSNQLSCVCLDGTQIEILTAKGN